MAVYNCERTLEVAINSILNQTFTNFEYIICNDGSTDNSLSILKNYKNQDSRIIIIDKQQNQGLSIALNDCIKKSQGIFLARMDGDDISKPHRFQTQIDFLENHPEYAFCGSSVEIFDETGIWGQRITIEKPQKLDFLSVSPFVHPSIMFRAKIIKDIGLYKVENIGRSEDYELFMRLYTNRDYGYNIQEILLSYREDKYNLAKRKIKYLLIESKIRYNGFKNLQLFPKALPYIIRPIVLALIPKPLRQALHKLRYKKRK